MAELKRRYYAHLCVSVSSVTATEAEWANGKEGQAGQSCSTWPSPWSGPKPHYASIGWSYMHYGPNRSECRTRFPSEKTPKHSR